MTNLLLSMLDKAGVPRISSATAPVTSSSFPTSSGDERPGGEVMRATRRWRRMVPLLASSAWPPPAAAKRRWSRRSRKRTSRPCAPCFSSTAM